jgi:hypothetical protein
VLPCFPFVFVWIGRVAFVFTREWWQGGSSLREERHVAERRATLGRRVVTGIAAAALAWSIGVAFLCCLRDLLFHSSR